MKKLLKALGLSKNEPIRTAMELFNLETEQTVGTAYLLFNGDNVNIVSVETTPFCTGCAALVSLTKVVKDVHQRCKTIESTEARLKEIFKMTRKDDYVLGFRPY